MPDVQSMHTFTLTPSKAMYIMYTFFFNSVFLKNKINIIKRF